MSALKDHRLERLIFFSDAVIAIAITLLIIEIKVPVLPHGDVAGGLQALKALLPSFLGFAISFLVIGRFWLGHSAALAAMSSYDSALFRPNLYFLMMIVIMPFSTALLSANMGDPVAVGFYNVALTLTALANLMVIRIATGDHSQHDPAERAALRQRGLIVVGAALACLGLGLVEPAYGEVPILAILFADRLFGQRGAAAGMNGSLDHG